MHWTSQKFVNNTFPTSADNSIQFQCDFTVAMSNHIKQTHPKLPHEAPPPLCCSKPPAVPGVTSEKPINWSDVAAGPPYLQCYYLDNSKHIVNFLLQKQVNAKVLHHQQLWIHLCWSISMQVIIVPSRRQIRWNTWRVQPTNNRISFKIGEFCHPFFPP